MEPITLTASAIALLSPYFTKAAESFAEEAGKVVFEKTTALWKWIKGRLGSALEQDVTASFEKDPESYAPLLKKHLTARLQESPEFARDLARLLEEIKSAAPTLNVVMKMKEAEEAVGVEAKSLTRSTVNVRMEIEKGKKVTGAKIDNI